MGRNLLNNIEYNDELRIAKDKRDITESNLDKNPNLGKLAFIKSHRLME